MEAPHTYIPPQGGLAREQATLTKTPVISSQSGVCPKRWLGVVRGVHEKLTPRSITTEDAHLAKRPIPSLVSRALVRRRQRWRPPLRRRAELVGRPHGEPASAVVRSMACMLFLRRRPPGGPYIYPHTHIPVARGATRGARMDTYIHRVGGRRPARPIPTYPTRAGGGRRGR